MADEKKPKERKKPIEPETTTKALGATPGKNAPAAEAAEPAPTAPRMVSTKIPKLQKKDKSRLPRRQKKARQKATAAEGKV
jgi:hypothetical protein